MRGEAAVASLGHLGGRDVEGRIALALELGEVEDRAVAQDDFGYGVGEVQRPGESRRTSPRCGPGCPPPRSRGRGDGRPWGRRPAPTERRGGSGARRPSEPGSGRTRRLRGTPRSRRRRRCRPAASSRDAAQAAPGPGPERPRGWPLRGQRAEVRTRRARRVPAVDEDERTPRLPHARGGVARGRGASSSGASSNGTFRIGATFVSFHSSSWAVGKPIPRNAVHADAANLGQPAGIARRALLAAPRRGERSRLVVRVSSATTSITDRDGLRLRGRLLLEPGVALLLELERELLAASSTMRPSTSTWRKSGTT